MAQLQSIFTRKKSNTFVPKTLEQTLFFYFFTDYQNLRERKQFKFSESRILPDFFHKDRWSGERNENKTHL
eukprot:TRINITY_DN17416_c0_g1_i1.p1 TRINITY_DN17416_c0_g1~~TRINITY_DN17416_c0_g1_i1.p1  ORF type:complete len:71 (-),score=8.15 TRINITY_DN17416_c0_g1_i1:202-414(-)